ncbi:MAG TPA: cupredoxin domain-containing protein [Chloroflexota bacterium]|nr:cupredoxin domain-containing protein [Chloroflexota bacterium]
MRIQARGARPVAVLGTLGAGLLLLAGCGSSPAAPSLYTMRHPAIVANGHGKFPDAFYEPNPIRVRVGQSITWTNMDSDLHDVTSDSGAFASGVLAQGGTFTWVPTRPGTYTYSCTLHPEMHGTIIVHG